MEKHPGKKPKGKPKAAAFALAVDWAKAQNGSNFRYMASLLKIKYDDFNNIRQQRTNPSDDMIQTLDNAFPGFALAYENALAELKEVRPKTVEQLKENAKKEQEDIKQIVSILSAKMLLMEEDIKFIKDKLK